MAFLAARVAASWKDESRDGKITDFLLVRSVLEEDAGDTEDFLICFFFW